MGHLDQFFRLTVRRIFQDLRSDGRMGLHDLEFLRCQTAGFIQNLLRDGDLSDIVQSRRIDDQSDIRQRQVDLIGLLQQLL